MSLASLPFLLALLTLATLFFYLPTLWARQTVLTACNAGFLYLVITNAASWAALAAFLLSGYLAALVLRRWPHRVILAGYLVVLIAFFLVARRYEIVTAHLPDSVLALGISVVGLSYMLFRQIQLLVDMLEGQVERISLFGFLNFQLSLFTLLSGPIQRYQEFQSQWDRLEPVLADGHAVRRAYFRLLIGLVKMTVVATFFSSQYQGAVELLQHAGALNQVPARFATIGQFLTVFYCYPIYLYANFSGYCDIVIAAALLVGLTLPENFSQPYLSRNVIDFWTRWHRTLGFWIRDYLFLPLYMAIAKRWPPRAESLAFLCYFIAFFIAGIWHGPTTNFVVYGLLQAIGVSAAKLWERHLLKKGGRKGLREYVQSTTIRWIAIVATLHYECFSLLFFPTDLSAVSNMLETVGRAALGR